MYEKHTIQMHRDKETLEKIKIKVERIKSNQRKFEPNLISAKNHQEAVRYNGKFLYEELIEKSEFDPRQNDSTIESEESFLLRNQSRFDSFRNVSRYKANESNDTIDEDTMQSNYDFLV